MIKFNVREVNCKLLEAVDEGMIDAKHVLEMCLSYMSEDDVKGMCQVNDILEYINPVYEFENDDGYEEVSYNAWTDYYKKI